MYYTLVFVINMVLINIHAGHIHDNKHVHARQYNSWQQTLGQ